MDLGSLKRPQGAAKKKKRVGRGDGSGHGGTACRGTKGQNARSGGKVAPTFEGGQMPITRRLPKRGFRNPFRKEVSIVNVGRLSVFPSGTVVDEEILIKSGLVKKRGALIKILGKGELTQSLVVKVPLLSKQAREKIVQAGGTIIEVR